LSHTLSCVKKDMLLVRQDNQTILIDQGALCERANVSAWVQYHLVPDIIRATGSLTIDHFVIPRPTIRALEAAAALMQHAQVGTLYYPVIEGELVGSYRTAFRKCYAIAKEHGVNLCRIRHETALTIGNQTIAIVPKEKMQYREITFKKISIFQQS
jgi:selenophosphate synthase